MIVTAVFALLTITVIATIKIYPAFGAAATGERLERMKASRHFEKGIFKNLIPTGMNTHGTGILGATYDFLAGNKDRQPNWTIPVVQLDPKELEDRSESGMHITWLGHSAVLIELDGKVIFADPMMGKVPAPFEFIGTKRFSSELPIKIEELPYIDIVILSHDHYDHLDHGSIMKLKEKVGQFYMPLGVGAHLESWGVDPEKIHELDWFEDAEVEGIKLVATPARHFSGRFVVDKDKTLWSSWVIIGKNERIFFSGDSGYLDEFKTIGEKYGPFDITLLECGQYGIHWPDIHMMPEETVQAHIDLKGSKMMPIHWGAFNLSLHAWTEPVERLKKQAKITGIEVLTPRIGERFSVAKGLSPNEWWVQTMSNEQ
ncbi:MAG: MBL fold metallo-hydrolase [Bacteroidetes bacterium]|nr:MBL fold metallo-hydrolase [Bacteroidota bacterium]